MPKVLRRLPNAKLLIVGDGLSTGDLKLLSKELHIEDSVIFAGEQPWEQIGKFYRLGDVFVSASVTETQGLTIIEAMASDVPVVAKDDRNIEGLIQDNWNGRIFKSENELPDILIEILTHKELSNRYIINARKTMDEYSAEQFGEKIENLYYRVLERYSRLEKRDHNGPKKLKKVKAQKTGL